jgi:hypothetical protein
MKRLVRKLVNVCGYDIVRSSSLQNQQSVGGSTQVLGVDEAFIRYRDKHKGDRCIIIGNGPSLNRTNLDLLEGEVNHFHADYRKPGETWIMPRLDRQRAEFVIAREFLEARGVKILNASRFTKLDVWERVDFDSLFD